jgi:phage protein D
MTESLFRSTAPVFKVEGTPRGELARDVVRLEVDECTEGLRTLRARFVAQGPRGSEEREQQLYLDGQIFDFGRRVEVSIGPGDGSRVIFRGKLSAIEAAFAEGEVPIVEVFAEDELMALRMTRRMRTYTNISDAGIARAIAQKHSLEATATASGPTYDVVQQLNVSDLAFLRERARLVQAEVWVRRGTLHFESRSSREGTSITLVRGTQLLDVRLRADLAHQRSAVHVSGYDAQQRAVIDETIEGSVIRSEASGGRTGPEILGPALGERVSHRTREVPLVGDEAKQWARAELLRRARSFVTVSGTTNGTPEMVVGSKLTLQRVGAPFEGAGYYVTRVSQTYDQDNGHRTQFEAERATLGAFR